MRTIKFRSVVKAFCHKQDSLMRGAATFVDRGRRTTHKSIVEMLTPRHPTVLQKWSTPNPDIGRKSRFLPQLGGFPRIIAITFYMEKRQEVKVIWQKAPHGGPIPRLGVTPGGRQLYHW